MTQLRIPGPTPCPPEVMQAMAWPMINHRGPEYHKMLQEVTEKLKQVFQTKNDLYILTGSGTGGLEAAVVNTLSPGDKVLAVSIGAFGDRFAAIAETFGAEVKVLSYEWGQAADPEEVRALFRKLREMRDALGLEHLSMGMSDDFEVAVEEGATMVRLGRAIFGERS